VRQAAPALNEQSTKEIGCLLGVKLGHSAMSAQCPVCTKADLAWQYTLEFRQASQRNRATFLLCWPATLSIVCAVGLLGLVDLSTSPSHTSNNLPPGLLFVAPASLHHRWDAFDDNWVQRLGLRRAWVEPVRAALLLKIGDLVVGQLDVVLALARAERVPVRKPVDDHAARPASRQAHRDIATRVKS
jgi:hypothetical protein